MRGEAPRNIGLPQQSQSSSSFPPSSSELWCFAASRGAESRVTSRKLWRAGKTFQSVKWTHLRGNMLLINEFRKQWWGGMEGNAGKGGMKGMMTTRKKDGVEAEAYFREGGRMWNRDASACVCYGQAKHEANLISSGSKNTLLRMNCNGDFYSVLPLLNTPMKLRLGCDG